MMLAPRKRFPSLKPRKPVDKARQLQKFLDTKKDAPGRYKSLKALLEGCEINELQNIFKEHYPHVVYVFYENFLLIENSLKNSKATKSLKEDLDLILLLLERILILLPDLLHSKWQLNCLDRIMRKLLHPGNASKIRREGVRLFLLWFQALRENAGEAQIEIFKSLIPGILLPDIATYKAEDAKAREHRRASVGGDWVQGDDVVPLLVTGEKPPENISKHYLDWILYCMTNQIALVEWNDTNRAAGFQFIFEQFKMHYLPAVFPNLCNEINVYEKNKPVIDVDQIHDSEDSSGEIKTVTGQVLHLEGNDMNGPLLRETIVKWVLNFIKPENETPQTTAGKSSHDYTHSHAEDDQASLYINKIVRNVLLNYRPNINLIHQIFRQVYILPIKSHKITCNVIDITNSWIHSREHLFLLESSRTGDLEDVRAGLQANLRLFITYSCNFFMVNLANQNVKDQAIVVSRIIRMYREMVMKVDMTKDTWEQLLSVLLVVASKTMKGGPFTENSIGNQLGQAIIKTVFTSWVTAALKVNISDGLWNKLLKVMSSLTNWPIVIKEWQCAMESLTKQLARYVYNIDFNNMPLDRLSEQKAKKKRNYSETVKSNQQTTEDAKSNQSDPSRKTQPNKDQEIIKTITVVNDHPDMNSPKGSIKNLSESSFATPLKPQDNFSRNDLASIDGDTSNVCKSSFDNVEGSFSSASTIARENESIPIESYDKIENTTTDDSASQSSRKVSVNTEDNTSTGSDSEKYSEDSSLSAKDSKNNLAEFSDSKLNESIGHKNTELSNLSETTVDNLSNTQGINDNAKVKLENVPNKKRKSLSIQILRKEPIQEQDSTPVSPISPSDLPALPSASYDANSQSFPDNDNEINLELLNQTSLLAGGNKPGWCSTSAIIIYQRILGCLGNISKLKDPSVHAIAIDALTMLWYMLVQIRANQGISEDNKTTPSVPEFLPPLRYFVAWLFQSCTLEKEFKSGRMRAYALLSNITVCRQDIPLSDEYLAHFYRLLHSGLIGNDQDITNVIVANCYQMNCYNLRGSSILLLDFIHAACTIIDSQEMMYPRFQATTLLGSLLPLLDDLNNMPILQAGAHGNDAPTDSNTAKEEVIEILLKAAKDEISSHARSIALNSVGIYIVKELEKEIPNPRIKDCFNVLLAQLKFLNNIVAAVAIDNLRTLCYVYQKLAKFDELISVKIIESLCASIIKVVVPRQRRSMACDTILISLLLCLLEWLMVIPYETMIRQDKNRISLFQIVSCTLRAIIKCDDDSTRTELQAISGMKFVAVRELRDGNVQSKKSLDQIAEVNYEKTPDDTSSSDAVLLAAKFVMSHILNYHSHFPFRAGASLLEGRVKEFDDDPRHSDITDLSAELLASPNIQFFIFNDRLIITLVEIPKVIEEPNGFNSERIVSASTNARVIIRDIVGKYIWDTNALYKLSAGDSVDCADMDDIKDSELQIKINDGTVEAKEDSSAIAENALINNAENLEEIDTESTFTSLPEFALDVFPEDEDRLDVILQHIENCSDECFLQPGTPINAPVTNSTQNMHGDIDEEMVYSISEQIECEREYLRKKSDSADKFTKLHPIPIKQPSSIFYQCYFILNQLGYLSWENRARFDLLKKSEMLLRELKNLDNRHCRETHKLAVIYIANGQEDKRSIFSNLGGSKDYEEFVAGLAWEVDLSTHVGFLGGLQQNESTGTTAPYFATSTTEVLFHVATRMPSSDETLNKKVRHLGNDEIQIVWSEHTRDYRRGIINTEFADVIIVIYPLKNGLYRIQIDKKPEIPLFGPLFDGAVISKSILPVLVRATAINASRAKRSQLPLYRLFFEERDGYITNIAKSYKDLRTFESFICDVLYPVFPEKSNDECPEIIKEIDERIRDDRRNSSNSMIKEAQTTVV